jgi:RHS repeat-associated protein
MQALHQKTLLLVTDLQSSVLNRLDEIQPNPLAYTPYGHRPAVNGLLSLLGFNGEQPDPLTGHYHLGNGYRQFNPVLMRFNSPDSWSPFGKGGLNAYVYCLGDPINRIELSGHSSLWIRFWKGFKNRIGVRTPSKFDSAKLAKKQAENVSAPLSNQPSAKHNNKASSEAKTFDLNKLSPDELELNYRPTGNLGSKELKYPIKVTHKKFPAERLEHLRKAETNLVRRVMTDSPQTKLRREKMLESIREDIAQLEDQVKNIRSSAPLTV